MTSILTTNPTTGDAWMGPMPTHASWDRIAQSFAFVRPEDSRDASPDERTAAAMRLAGLLDAPPKARQPHPPGVVTRPPFKLACPGCGDAGIVVPVDASLGPDGSLMAWFGKGICSCPACGYNGKSARMGGYSMYEYTDLIKERAALGPGMIARMAP